MLTTRELRAGSRIISPGITVSDLRNQRDTWVLTAIRCRLRFLARVRLQEMFWEFKPCSRQILRTVESRIDELPFWLAYSGTPSPPVLLQRIAFLGKLPVELQSSALLSICLVSWTPWLRFGGGVSPLQAHTRTRPLLSTRVSTPLETCGLTQILSRRPFECVVSFACIAGEVCR